MKNRTKALVLFMIAQSVSGFLWAGFGVSSAFAKVQMGSVEPGKIVRVSSVSQPLTVTNTSDIPVRLTLRVTRPKRNEVDEGYAPVPTVVWAVLEKNEFTLEPGESATTDIILKPPLDQTFQNKRYQVHVLSRVVSSGNVRIVMVHKLQFSISKEVAISSKRSGKESLQVEPLLLEAKGIDLGRLAEDQSRTLVVHNKDKKSHLYRIRTFNPEASEKFETYAVSPVSKLIQNRNESSGFMLQPGQQKAVGPSGGMAVVFDQYLPRNWVSVGVKEFELTPGEKRIFPVKIFIPNYEPFKSKKVASLIRVTQLDDGFSSMFVPVIIETTSNGFSEAAPSEFQKRPYVDVCAEIAQ